MLAAYVNHKEADIMKIRTLLGLAAIGGVAYAHQKRGGEWTLNGIKDTLRDLFSGVQEKVRGFADEAKERIEDTGSEFTSQTSKSTGNGVGSDLGYSR
jgi:hypothetical protein